MEFLGLIPLIPIKGTNKKCGKSWLDTVRVGKIKLGGLVLGFFFVVVSMHLFN